MYTKTLVALLALSASSLNVGYVAAQLQCGDIADLESYCKTDCGDSEFKSSECGPYGADCYCLNAAGDIENTNVDAPLECQGSNVVTVCAEECGKVQSIEDFSCENTDVVCTCAADDGIKGVGDDASEEDEEYADSKDTEAAQIAEDILNQVPQVAQAPSDISSSDTLSDEQGSIPPQEAIAPSPSSGFQMAVGSSILAAAFGLVLA